MSTTTQDETPTRPSRRPYALPLENGLRRVKPNSVEYDALLGAGYVVQEQDDVEAILRLDRRAAKARPVTNGDLHRYRQLEASVLDRIAADLTAAGWCDAAGNPATGAWIRGLMDEFRSRVMRETGSARTVVSGRIR